MRFLGALLLSCLILNRAGAQDRELEGLWSSKRYFGPEVRGNLELRRDGERWRATIGARSADVRVSRDSVLFDIPAVAYFRGRFLGDRQKIVGHWFEPYRRTAMPIVLSSCSADENCYSAAVEPLEDEFTFHMTVERRADGRLGAFLRNPERNQGRFIGLDHLERRGDTVDLRNARGETIVTGLMRMNALSVPLRFATHDFRKVHADSFTFHYPRGRPSVTYAYETPRVMDDGWGVARARDLGFSEEKLAEMVRSIADAPADAAGVYRPHGLLIARHGKLVLEEYFFGEHADKPHDTRSASKSLVSVVLGAAMHAGLPVAPQTPVFATMGLASPTLDRRKRAMTLRHLLTMSAGLDCDDNAPDAERYPGSEDVLTDQNANPDWLAAVLNLAMLREPGERAVYCSIQPFLAGEVIARATGRSFFELAWELVGEPLQMGRYSILTTPFGQSYMGGGARFTLRDFAKLAQLYANGGTWNGRRVLTEEWVRESTEPVFRIGRTFRQGPSGPTETTTSNYGYLWWTTEFEHHGRVVRAHHASGNGGQYSMFIPALDLVIATYGGNYADPGGFYALRELVPKAILPALER